jgi:hypothetical protein
MKMEAARSPKHLFPITKLHGESNDFYVYRRENLKSHTKNFHHFNVSHEHISPSSHSPIGTAVLEFPV